jgi:hypothetical protein
MSRISRFVLVALAFGFVVRASPRAQTGLPLLHQSSLMYVGGFRLPEYCEPGGILNTFYFGGDTLAFNPPVNGGAGSLFVKGRSENVSRVAEVSIPELVISATITDLHTATCLQPFYEATDGLVTQAAADASISGMVVFDGKLWINNGSFYDTAGQTRYTLSRPLELSVQGQADGLYGLTSSQSGFIPSMAAKSIAAISSDWISLLGGSGNLFLSKFGTSIVTSTSWGPDAIMTQAAMLSGAPGTYPALETPLFYDGPHNPAGPCGQSPPPGPNTPPPALPGVVTNGVVQCTGPGGEASNFPGATRGSTYSWWSAAHYDSSLVQPRGTSTLLVFQVAGATKGTSEGGYGYGYGCGCSDPATAPGGSTCWGIPINPAECSVQEGFWYDPESGYKGVHGFPYFYQVVAYDMNRLVDVYNHILRPWEPRPYEYWTFSFPISPNVANGEATELSNAAYDSVNNRIYIAQRKCCDVGGLETKPIIHVFQVNP